MARPNDIDPELLSRLAGERTTRRRFIGRGAAAAAAVAISPAILAACSSSSDSESTSNTTAASGSGGTAEAASGTLRISNWPLYIGASTVSDFQDATGVTVDYQENFNDNEEWFAKYKDALDRKQDIGADLVVPTDFMAARLIELGWLSALDDANIPNKANLRPQLLNVAYDNGRKYTLPWVSGMVGLAYNKAATGRDVTSMDDFFSDEFKGKVSMLSDLRDGVGMMMMYQGNSPEDPTTETVQQAVDGIGEQKDKGQIRRFTGNDYADDLAAGNIVIAQAYSGDVAQLQADNPDLEFVVPESGSTLFSDNMVIPYTTKNQAAAEAWMNWIYDRANYAQLISEIQYIPALSDMTDALAAVDPDVASNPLINPDQSTLDQLKVWKALTSEQDAEFTDMYAQVTGE